MTRALAKLSKNIMLVALKMLTMYESRTENKFKMLKAL